MGFGMSGDGPAMFALCFNKLEAENIVEKTFALCKTRQIDVKAWVSPIGFEGVRLY